MEYLNYFNTVSDANTAGGTGMNSPHVDYVVEKKASNFVKTPQKKNFTCEYNNNGKIYNVSVIEPFSEKYQQVEYLQSNGTQYIQTDLIVNQRFKYIADVQYTRTDVDQRLSGIYDRNNSSYPISYGIACNNDFKVAAMNYTGYSWSTFLTGDTNRHLFTYDMINGKVYENSTQKADLGNVFRVSESNKKLPIFACDDYVKFNYYCYMKLYSFKLYDSTNTLYHDFIPCYRKSDSVPGLYDLVTNKFFTNQGSGNFIVGPDIN